MRPQLRDLSCVWLFIITLAVPATYLDALAESSQGPPAPAAKTLTRGGVTFVWQSTKLTAKDDPSDNGRPDLHQIEMTPGYGTLIASWPQASAKTPDWAAWNIAIEAAALKMAQSQAGSNHTTTAKWAAQPGVDTRIDVSIGAVSKTLVSSTVSAIWDSHGAHPNHGSTEFNWLLDKQRALKPEDVFKPASSWAQTLQKRTDAYLHHQLDQGSQSYETFLQPGEMQRALHSIVIDPKNWRLGGNGLSIVFQPYAIACYACTPPPFTIPWPDLKAMLNRDFVVPGKS
jgi:Protein of unknown function (DUF3298)